MGIPNMKIRERLEGFAKQIHRISAEVGRKAIETVENGFDGASRFIDKTKSNARVAVLAGMVGTSALSCIEAPDAVDKQPDNNNITVSAQGAESVEKDEKIKLLEYAFNDLHLYATFDLKERAQAPIDVEYINQDGEVFDTEQWLIDRENLGFESRDSSQDASRVRIQVLNDDMTQVVQSYEFDKVAATRPNLP